VSHRPTIMKGGFRRFYMEIQPTQNPGVKPKMVTILTVHIQLHIKPLAVGARMQHYSEMQADANYALQVLAQERNGAADGIKGVLKGGAGRGRPASAGWER